jgi:beta-aspartyl-peptidase (threonine type)
MRALKGGLISRVTIHAIDVSGIHKVVAVNGAGDNKYWLWEGKSEPRLVQAEPVVITGAETRSTPAARYASQ